MISIHAPRGGSDFNILPIKNRRSHFNPRSPWGERRYMLGNGVTLDEFQSTLPVGGATVSYFRRFRVGVISIHAPRGGSDFEILSCTFTMSSVFQSTLPVGGATLHCSGKRYCPCQFQSTLPVGGATQLFIEPREGVFISIHAPRGGSDPTVR